MTLNEKVSSCRLLVSGQPTGHRVRGCPDEGHPLEAGQPGGDMAGDAQAVRQAPRGGHVHGLHERCKSVID